MWNSRIYIRRPNPTRRPRNAGGDGGHSVSPRSGRLRLAGHGRPWCGLQSCAPVHYRSGRGSRAAAVPLGRRRLLLAQNGELYDYKRLRADLISRGARFRTKSDSELVLHLYPRFGLEDMLPHLRGEFAFALYDRETRSADAGTRPLRHQAAVLDRSRTVPWCSVPN